MFLTISGSLFKKLDFLCWRDASNWVVFRNDGLLLLSACWVKSFKLVSDAFKDAITLIADLFIVWLESLNACSAVLRLKNRIEKAWLIEGKLPLHDIHGFDRAFLYKVYNRSSSFVPLLFKSSFASSFFWFWITICWCFRILLDSDRVRSTATCYWISETNLARQLKESTQISCLIATLYWTLAVCPCQFAAILRSR